MAPFDLAYSLLCASLILFSFFAKYRNGYLYLCAISAWSISEILNYFYHSQWASVGYVLFYPLVFLAIPTLFLFDQSNELIRLLDGAILACGLTTIASATLLKKVEAPYLHLVYLICDLLLLIAMIVAFNRQSINSRTSLILSGYLIFAATDYFYISINNGENSVSYPYLKYGWLIGFCLMTLAQYLPGKKSDSLKPITFTYLAFSVLVSSSILMLLALGRYDVPSFVIGPAVTTLLITFLRIAFSFKQSEKILAQESLARIDDLTGLPNRRKFISELEKFVDGSILLMDLDKFKPVNDLFGHAVGDEILKQVSSRFQKVVPEGALLARLGGDEFAVLTHESYEQAMELALALRATLSYPFNVDGEQIKIDVSIGCVTNDGGSNLMNRADTAMYQAKRAQVGVWASGT